MANLTSLLLLIGALVVGGAQLDSPAPKPAYEERSIEQELAPPSELALMMRAMAVHADSVKAAVDRGGELPPKPKAFKELLTAQPTKGMHIDPITFPTFGKDYQAKLGRLYKAKRSDRAQAYNALIQSCANCHGTHCPGPLMRIKNMYLPIEQ